jgi:hypothetical protein
MSHFSEINFREKDPRINSDKTQNHSSMNSKLNNRDLMDIQIQKGMNNYNKRLGMERNEFMMQSRNKNVEDIEENNLNELNEIKNENENEIENEIEIKNENKYENKYDIPERGMPMRPDYNLRKDPQRESESSSFIIKNKNNTTKLTANDSNSKGYASFSSFDDSTQILSQLKNDIQTIINSNDYTIFLLKNLASIIRSPFIISSYDIYKLFGSIYIASVGNTEIELKNYFNFPSKDILLNGLTEINSKHQTNHQKTGICLLFNNQISFNEDYYKNISKFMTMRKININQAKIESNNINEIISKFTTHDMKKTITSSNIEFLSSLGITFGYLNPTFLLNNVNIKSAHFSSIFLGPSMSQYIEAYNQKFGYIEKEQYKILEIALEGLNDFFGIILFNEPQLNFDKKDLQNAIKNLKPVYFKKISFPLFAIQTKMKMKNIFKSTDLKTVFADLNIPELFSDRIKLDEVLVNIEFKIEPKFKKININTDDFKSDKEFIVNRTFIFYFKNRSNLITSFGIF